MDPEDLREVISAYQKCIAEVVGRLGGYLAKYPGDGVLVYFGYPKAHEDDAERAVRAGLELIAAVTALKSNAPLQSRVGIATGLVVVGDLIESGEARERGIVGETPNLAARLQGVAEPNQVVIAESTRSLLGNLFEFADLRSKDLKGMASPHGHGRALRFLLLSASRFIPYRHCRHPIPICSQAWIPITTGRCLSMRRRRQRRLCSINSIVTTTGLLPGVSYAAD
jgi:hypothetical protein